MLVVPECRNPVHFWAGESRAARAGAAFLCLQSGYRWSDAAFGREID